jgi:hypothetical protein
MTKLSGQKVTERMLNNWTAAVRDNYRWPAELDRAFCTVTGDPRLLTFRVKLYGLHVIQESELHLLELGRAVHQRSQAEEKIEALQQRLRGGVA